MAADAPDGARVLAVTGASGLVGASIVETLLARFPAARVVAVDARPPAADDPCAPASAALRDARVRRVVADVRDVAALTEAFQGVECVFHVAAVIATSGSPALAESINVDGTRAVVTACRRAHVRQLVYTSSCVVVFSGQAHTAAGGADESLAVTTKKWCPYVDTKARAERIVLAEDGGGLATAAVRLCGQVYGGGDTAMLRFLPQIRWSSVATAAPAQRTHRTNAATAHVAMYERLRVEQEAGAEPGSGVRGSAVFVGDSDVDADCLPVPAFQAEVLEFAAVLASPVFGRRPVPLAVFEVYAATTPMVYLTARARRLLNWRPTVTLADGLREAVAYVRCVEARRRR